MSKFGVFGTHTGATLVIAKREEGDGVSLDIVNESGGYEATICTIQDDGILRLNPSVELAKFGIQLDKKGFVQVERPNIAPDATRDSE